MENGYLIKLSSVCELIRVSIYCFCTTYGGMRPGMPPGRKHFRRSRDAPISEKDFGQSFLSKICLYLRADGRMSQ